MKQNNTPYSKDVYILVVWIVIFTWQRLSVCLCVVNPFVFLQIVFFFLGFFLTIFARYLQVKVHTFLQGYEHTK